MRVAVVSSLLLVAGCGGGGGKPADTENSLASLEPSGSSSQDMPPPPESTASPHPAAAASAATAPASAPAAHAVVHPTPSANGTIEGKSFSPKLALVAGAMQKDGRILISLTEGSDCVAPGDTAQPGTASLTVTVPYKDGMKADLSAMKRPNGKTAGEIAFSRVSDAGKAQVSTTFKATGTVTMVSAPTDPNAFGRMRIDLQSGDYMLAGDLDVKVCTASK